MLPSWASETVIRLRPATRIVRGSPILDWNNPEQMEISGCSIQPASTTLTQDGRIQGISEGYTCYLPPGSDVRAGDRIRFDENDYTINGEPENWKSPTGRVSSMQLHLERWRG